MNKNQRLKEIVNILRRRNVVNIKELTQKLSASDMTIRRDLSLLAEDSIVELIPGGAIFKPPIESEEKYFVTHEETVRTREKLKIGQKAASFIEPNDTVIIDIGSTSEYVAKFMREDVPVTVMCFSLNILAEVYRKKNCNVIFAGGYYHGETMMFESPEGIELVKRTRADKAFVSAAGIHLDLGVTTVYPHELETKKAILGSAKTRILVVDSSKFGKIKSVYFAELAGFHTIITDAQIPDPYARSIQDLGVQLIVV